jgi:hypothetical protein
MKTVIKITSFCILVFLVSSSILGQKRSIKRPTSKSLASSQRALCKGMSVPNGFVVVGYKSSANCGENSELIIKKPVDTEIICAGSPIPDGYHVVSQEGSPACRSTEVNPLTNALNIARDGVVSSSRPSSVRSSIVSPSQDNGDDEDSPRTSKQQRSKQSTNAQLQERADEINAKARWQLRVDEAIKEHKVIVGMTVSEVLQSWGTPNDTSAMTSPGSGTRRTLIYIKNGQSAHLQFEDGILQDWTWFH